MNKIEPKEKYVIIHPKDDAGNELKHSFILVLSRKLGEKVDGENTIGDRLMYGIGQMNGIDSFNLNVGLYSIGLTVARTFDPDEVITEVKRIVEEDVLSDIIKPRLVTP